MNSLCVHTLNRSHIDKHTHTHIQAVARIAEPRRKKCKEDGGEYGIPSAHTREPRHNQSQKPKQPDLEPIRIRIGESESARANNRDGDRERAHVTPSIHVFGFVSRAYVCRLVVFVCHFMCEQHMIHRGKIELASGRERERERAE